MRKNETRTASTAAIARMRCSKILVQPHGREHCAKLVCVRPGGSVESSRLVDWDYATKLLVKHGYRVTESRPGGTDTYKKRARRR